MSLLFNNTKSIKVTDACLSLRTRYFVLSETWFLPLLAVPLLMFSSLTRAQQTLGSNRAEQGRVFVINAPVKSLAEFSLLLNQVAVLKPYGAVRVNISTLADKGFYEIPEQGSAWHEYASANPTPYKFFPDPAIAPFIPADFVKKNRSLLLSKAKMLKDHGMEAAFIGYEPNFLPMAFFDAYPEMLGPRVDHPRRSTQKAFAPCISVKATQEMYASMMAEMLRQAPEIKDFSFKTNDAGAGICWADWLYTGPNGPVHCRGLSMGERMQLLLNAFKEGARRAEQPLSIYVDAGSSNFSDAERTDIEAHLPPDCYFLNREDRDQVTISGTLPFLYPVKGIVNPFALLEQLQALDRSKSQTVWVNFRAAYDRGLEPAEVRELMLTLMVNHLQNPAVNSTGMDELKRMKQYCEQWAGAQNAASLLKAFVMLDEAMRYKSAAIPRVHSLYWGVTERIINRPLIIAPQKLSTGEESYFLPFVFNIDANEARMDYMDIHGGRQTAQKASVDNYVSKIRQVAEILEKINGDAPKASFFRRMATALQIHACIMRSCGNFAAAQAIRDRDSALLDAPPRLPSKEAAWEGHPDYIPFNNIMRDELDNTLELIRLLEHKGASLVVMSADPAYEDRFLLGPQLIDQLKLKRKIMLHHWEDIQEYLASPLK
jgi:hypothetical protein